MTLSERSFEFAKKLIDERCFVLDDRDDWSEHQPSAQHENASKSMDSARAAQRKYTDVETAAAHLHGMLDKMT